MEQAFSCGPRPVFVAQRSHRQPARCGEASFGDGAEAPAKLPQTLLALAYYQAVVPRDNELAKTTYRQVGKMLPGNSEVPFALAGIAQRQGQWDEATAYFDQALLLDPRNTDLLVEAASNFANLRKFEAALKLFDRALDIPPSDPDVMAFKAGIYQAEGNLEEAAKLLRDVNAETPSLVVFATKITQLTLERNLSEALRLLRARVKEYHFGSDLEQGAFTGALAFTQRRPETARAQKLRRNKRATFWSRSLRISQPTALRGNGCP